MCTGALLSCVSVHHIYAVPREARRGPWILVAGMTDGCKLPCGCWQSNLYRLEEQSVLITEQFSSLFCKVHTYYSIRTINISSVTGCIFFDQ